MKTRLILTLFLSFSFYLLSSQIPQGFNYQAIARGSDGKEIANTSIQVKLSVLSDTNGFRLSGTGTYIWEEQQTVTTNSFGLFTITFGNPLATKIQGSASSFSAIDWKQQPLYIGTKINYSGWKIMGASRFSAIPYSLLSKDLAGPVNKLAVTGTTPFLDEALFEVKNKDGRTVFAVYNEGVRIYVDDGIAGKSNKGGFAIGGFDKAKGTIQNYMLVKPDTIRMWIDDTPGKALKGGFAIGGFDKAKGPGSEYLGLKPTVPEIINPSQARILWYPLKEAFMTGRVYVPNPDSVGFNSFASGFESRAIGNWSQALGFDAISRGIYSTAIGLHSRTKGANSYAFGTDARASGIDSYAFGSHARATGPQSFAIGSVGVDTLGNPTGSTIASGFGSFAAGFGSVALGQGAFTLGVSDTASGNYSTAMGLWTVAKGPYSTSMGLLTKAIGWTSISSGFLTEVESPAWFGMANGFITKAGGFSSASFGSYTYSSGPASFATGFGSTAAGFFSSSFGDNTRANGTSSVAMGSNNTAKSYASLAIGRFNLDNGTSDTWYAWDPVFTIGNGTSATSRSNAMTVFKSGVADFAGYLNINSNSTGGAVYVNSKEALWFDGSVYSWGYDGSYNVFARKVSVGTIGSPGSYALYVAGSAYSSGTWAGSDIRWKKDLQPISNILPDLVNISCYSYNWRTDEFPEMKFDDNRQIGLVAQEVEKLFPDLVRTDEKGYKAVAYDKLSVILLQGMKEQQKEIEASKTENQKIRTELEELKKELDQVKSLLPVAGSR